MQGDDAPGPSPTLRARARGLPRGSLERGRAVGAAAPLAARGAPRRARRDPARSSSTNASSTTSPVSTTWTTGSQRSSEPAPAGALLPASAQAVAGRGGGSDRPTRGTVPGSSTWPALSPPRGGLLRPARAPPAADACACSPATAALGGRRSPRAAPGVRARVGAGLRAAPARVGCPRGRGGAPAARCSPLCRGARRAGFRLEPRSPAGAVGALAAPRCPGTQPRRAARALGPGARSTRHGSERTGRRRARALRPRRARHRGRGRAGGRWRRPRRCHAPAVGRSAARRRARDSTTWRTASEPRPTWDDLVLPEAQRAARCARSPRTCATGRPVYDELGLRARRAPRPRASARCSPAPSGTGKTMAAEVLAQRAAARPLPHRPRRRRQQVHRRDREEPAAACSTPPRAAAPILLFDEADALFGKRSEVQGQPRPLRQHRGQLPAAAHGGLPRPGDPDDQHEGRARHGVPAPPALRRRSSRSRTRRSARAIWRRRLPGGDADSRASTPTEARAAQRRRRQHPQHRA